MTVTIRITKEARLPDPVRLARMAKSPELGPRVLFFSGGSALKDLSAQIIRWSHNTIHVITPFDSGGSSAVLRKAFRMPAIGDVRNRLMALADRSLQGNDEIFALFAHRFPKDGGRDALAEELDRMVRGRHRLVAPIPDPMRKIIRHHLQCFKEWAPAGFDLAGASVGNLVLAAGYLENRRHMDPVIFIFSKLVQVRGVVRPVVNKDLHLAVRLKSGEVVLGQHRITGKEAAPLASPIQDIWLAHAATGEEPVRQPIRSKMRELIAQAELICYPLGSFYSSVLANLLPRGVGRAVAANACPKVFVPNPGPDPEAPDLSVTERVGLLLKHLRDDDPERITYDAVLNFVLVDTKGGEYKGGLDRKRLRSWGVEIIDCPLVTKESAPYLDGTRLAEVLMSLT